MALESVPQIWKMAEMNISSNLDMEHMRNGCLGTGFSLVWIIYHPDCCTLKLLEYELSESTCNALG